MENAIWEFIRGIIDPTQAIVLMALVLGNLFTGVFASILDGSFDEGKVWEFTRRMAVVFLAYVGVGIVAQVMLDMQEVQTAVWAFLIAQMGDKIFENLHKWGLPVPDHLPLVRGIVNLVGSPFRAALKKNEE